MLLAGCEPLTYRRNAGVETLHPTKAWRGRREAMQEVTGYSGLNLDEDERVRREVQTQLAFV
jgi:hypothetical protein